MSEAQKWKNQYIELVRSKPDYILPFVDSKLLDSEAEFLKKRCGDFRHHIVELGSGSGGHLIGLAARNPDTLCIGVEIRFKRTFRTAEKAEKQGITNLLMLKMDARHVFELFPDNFFEAVYVNFPDPWDKSGWKKHRLLTSSYLDTIFLHLKPSGSFLFKTDHDRYFGEVRELFNGRQAVEIIRETRDFHNSSWILGNIESEFESLFRSKKQPVCFLDAKKLAA